MHVKVITSLFVLFICCQILFSQLVIFVCKYDVASVFLTKNNQHFFSYIIFHQYLNFIMLANCSSMQLTVEDEANPAGCFHEDNCPHRCQTVCCIRGKPSTGAYCNAAQCCCG